MPYFNPVCTRKVWWPSCVDSLNKHKAQLHIVNIKQEIKNKIVKFAEKWDKDPIEKKGSKTCAATNENEDNSFALTL